MGLFICERCQVIENTALGLYWSRSDGPALCSQCAPAAHPDGGSGSRWHGRFRRRRATIADLPQVRNPEAFKPADEEPGGWSRRVGLLEVASCPCEQAESPECTDLWGANTTRCLCYDLSHSGVPS